MTQGEEEPRRRRAESDPGGKGGSDRLADLLRTRREVAGLSRRELAEVTGLSYPYISQLETGYRLPSAKVMQLLAAALGADPGDLFDAVTAAEQPDAAGPALPSAPGPRREQGRYLTNPAHVSRRGRPATGSQSPQAPARAGPALPVLAFSIPALGLDGPEPPADTDRPPGTPQSPGAAVATAVAALQSVPATERLAALNEVQAAVVAALVDELAPGG